MQNDYSSKKFKKGLDKIQRESWQLELLVLGFLIFGLVQTVDPLKMQMVEVLQVAEMAIIPL